MTRFRFDLEKLLQLRSFAEKEAELALARAMGEVAALDARIGQVAEERVAIASTRFAPGRSAAEMRNSELYLIRLDRMKDALLEAAVKAQLVVDVARDAFMEAKRDRMVLDKLKEKRLAEHRKVALAEQTRILDEVSVGAPARRLVSDGD